tara:strand:- start:171 stop:359 length:189 start_codon:yes stop_codon:yes gene_type:complete
MLLGINFFMTIDPSTESKKDDQSNFLESNNKKVICKDGFCFLPNQNENKPISSDNINIFDPL